MCCIVCNSLFFAELALLPLASLYAAVFQIRSQLDPFKHLVHMYTRDSTGFQVKSTGELVFKQVIASSYIGICFSFALSLSIVGECLNV